MEAQTTALEPGLRHQATRRHAAGRRFTLRTRFAIEMSFALAWVALSTYLALPWIDDLDRLIGPIPGWLTILGIALIPGYLNAHLLAALVLDRPTPLPPASELDFPHLSVLMAAYNEEAGIGDALDNVLSQEYPGEMEVVVVDDGSEDSTAEIVSKRAETEERLRLVRAPHGGKTAALNHGLAETTGMLISTVDADTRLAPGSLIRLASRLLIAPADTVACAGAVFVANPKDTLLAREQDWDYFLGIASIKRQQGLLQGTLVAQGAFSMYDAHSLKAVGGWPDAIGEDIVLTWAFLSDGESVSYEPTAIAFTEAPTHLGAYVRQRRRWARGMIEGLRAYGVRDPAPPPPLLPQRLRGLPLPLRGRLLLLRLPAGDRACDHRQLRDRRADDAGRAAAQPGDRLRHVRALPVGLQGDRHARGAHPQHAGLRRLHHDLPGARLADLGQRLRARAVPRPPALVGRDAGGGIRTHTP